MLDDPKKIYGVMALVCGNKVNASMIPKDKKAFNEYRSKTTDNDFKISNFPYVSHSAYNFKFWIEATDLYPVFMSNGFEPYYIGHRDYPLFDEVFFGCGRDKISHSTELGRAGYSIQIIPDGFIAHLSSDGLGKPWCENWSSDIRTPIKLDVFKKRMEKGIGHNYYVPPWVDADLPRGNSANNNNNKGNGEAGNENERIKGENEEMKKMIESLNDEIKRLTGNNVDIEEARRRKEEEEEEEMEKKKKDYEMMKEVNEKEKIIEEQINEIERIRKEAAEKEMGIKSEMEKKVGELENEIALLKKSIDFINEKNKESKRITAMTFLVVGVVVSVSFVIIYKYWFNRRPNYSNLSRR